MQFALFQTPVILAFLISLVLTIYTWKYRHEKVVWGFLGLLIGAMEWSFFYWLELASTSTASNLSFAKLEYVGIVMIPTSWLLFTVQYTEQGQKIAQYWRWLLIEPILIIALVWTNEYHHLVWDDWFLSLASPSPILNLTYGPMGWLNVLYSYLLFMISLIFIIRAIRQSSGIYRNQLLALLGAFFIPFVGNFLYISRISPYVDLSSFGFAISGFIVAWAIFRFKFLDVMPIAQKLIIQNLADGILILDENNKILDINQSARKMLGVQNTQAIGQPVREVLVKWIPVLDKYVGKISIEDEIVINGDTDAPRHLEVRVKPIYTQQDVIKGRIATIRDITDQREKENILKRQALLYESITDAVTLMRTDGTIFDCNNAHEELFGYTKAEILGKTPEIWHVPGNYALISEKILEGITSDGRWTGEIPYIRKDGATGICEGTVMPIQDNQAQVVGRIGVLRDVTQRKQAEVLLHTAKEAAEKANQAKSLFLANVSHELRTPLTAIIGYSELIELEMATADTDAVIHDLQKIRKSSDHLLNIVNSILNLARVEAQEVELYLDTVDLTSFLEEIKGIFQPLLEENNNKLIIQYPEDIGEIYSDATRLNQILINVLSNANKFTKDGELRLSVVRVQEQDTEWIHFKISDTGIGIAKDLHDAIFEPFNQADNSYTRAYGGTGLGLTITRAYCKLLQGEISVNSEAGEGATFIIKLPEKYIPPTSRDSVTEAKTEN